MPKMTDEERELKKSEIIEKLSQDYIEYLLDFDLEELELIWNMNEFTMSRVREQLNIKRI